MAILRRRPVLFLLAVLLIAIMVVSFGPLSTPSQAMSGSCIACHEKVTPLVVQDWRLSRHAAEDIDCSYCHGADHSSAADVAKVKTVTASTCSECHEDQFEQFSRGKHSLAWAARKAAEAATSWG